MSKPKKAKVAAKASAAAKRASKRKAIDGVHISPDTRVKLYERARSLPKKFKQDSGLLLPFVTYFQDPFVARDLHKAFDKVLVAWEPGLTDGPTSSRFAIVDYNADTGRLEPPAVWVEGSQAFAGVTGAPLDANAAGTFQFHQVSVWALLQCALAFFEDASALGRSIPWAFEGNRLIVVPHAGYGKNAYYDRASKSLQFYYFGPEEETGGTEDTVYTCLSSDIVHHELGHAVLDGIRPLFNESCQPQTAAFHEFMGDLTALLLTLKNGTLRKQMAESAGGRFKDATTLASLAEQFGEAVKGRPYLRTALNDSKMGGMANEMSPHRLCEVLTGAMYDVLIALGELYQEWVEGDTEEGPAKKKTPIEVFWEATDRMQRTAIQPLDLLPPVEATFRDYALAVCRSQQLSDPLDPGDYYGMLIKVFRDREILSADDEAVLREPSYLYERLDLSVQHNINDISRSRAAAYRFLDDNRENLLIPARRDFFVADLYDARKRGRQNLPLPRQIVVQYAWREEVLLDGPRFGRFAGRTTTMLCGGTLVFDENGNVFSWMKKPGSEPHGGKRPPGENTKKEKAWAEAVREGEARKAALLDLLAAQIATGRIGTLLGAPNGLMASMVPPMTAEGDGDLVRFQLSPHLHLSGAEDLANDSETGERQWEISC